MREENLPITKQRIGYIDSLRGLTMILVVGLHVAMYSNCYIFPYLDFFGLFRLPLFFFISGFIFYKQEQIWDFSNCIKFLSKKFLVQIIPTAFFLSLYMFIFSISTINAKYNGYWFTIALFEYFFVYVLFNFIIKKRIICDIVLLIIALILYILSNDVSVYEKFPFIYNAIIWNSEFFIFFLLGTLTKKYFDKVKIIFNKDIIMTIIIISVFIGACLFLKKYVFKLELKLAISILGLFSIFYFFMKNSNYIDNSRIGRVLQYIGRRTLDIYLLHIFFITNSISWVKDNGIDSPTIIFIISIATSFVITGICLLISNILRTNPLLGKILFGAKTPTKTAND